MSNKNGIVVCLLEELDILVAQIAAALQCTYLPITALSVPNTFITANQEKWICILWLGYDLVISDNDYKYKNVTWA